MEKITTKLIEREFSPLNECMSSTLNVKMFNMLNMPDLQSRFRVAREEWEKKQKTAFRQAELVNFISQRRKITKATVSLWFNGPTQKISYDNATLAAEFFGVNVEWLRTGKGKPYDLAHNQATSQPIAPLSASDVLKAYTVESKKDMRKEIVSLFDGLSKGHQETLFLLAMKLHSIEHQ